MEWQHGYFAEGGYTYGYYPETMPLRLHWAALVQGHQTPRRGFRYLDAGCGQGLNLILAASAHPDSEFVGVDFMPEHVAHGRRLAAAAGLANVTFVEGDFNALARDPAALGMFDFAVCHGITTWIAPFIRAALYQMVGQVLKPGGLFYNSYNTMPGWLGTQPFQHLVLLEQRRKSGPLALAAARQSMESLNQHAPGLMARLPGFERRLESMKTQDPAYLVQEYNNQYWQPMFVSSMFEELAAVKLSYAGTATLPEAFEANYAQGAREWLSGEADLTMKEQLRDYLVNQGFRRDLYVKGRARPWPLESERLLRECRFAVNPFTRRPEDGAPFEVQAGSMKLNGNPQMYGEVLELIQNSPDGSVGQVMDGLKTLGLRGTLPHMLSMLLHGGWILPQQASDAGSAEGARRLNLALATAASEGAPYRYMMMPRTGVATALGDPDWLMVSLASQGRNRDEWPAAIHAGLQRLGKALSKDGRPVTEPAEREPMLNSLVDDFQVRKLPFFKAQGAL